MDKSFGSKLMDSFNKLMFVSSNDGSSICNCIWKLHNVILLDYSLQISLILSSLVNYFDNI